MEMNERIRSRRKELKLTQADLAKLIKVNRVTVTGWESGDYKPGGENLQMLAAALKCHPQWLVDGTKKAEENVSYVGPYEPKGSFPVLSWVSAGHWAEAVESYHRKSIDRWYETTVECSDHSFWLDVKGDSMTAPAGLSIPEGMVILVDPEVEPINGKLVVAKIENDNEATFKKFVTDAGNKYLKPLNPQYSMIPINGNCTIIGVVVDAKIANLP